MSDQGFQVSQVLFEQLERARLRNVPFKPLVLDSEAGFAVVPERQIMRVTQLAACNPGAAAGTVSLWVEYPGEPKIAQLADYEVPANSAIDLTNLIGGMYPAGAVLSAAGSAGVVLSGHWEALL